MYNVSRETQPKYYMKEVQTMDNYLNLSTDWYHIRNMCINHNFYTCGDCREYQRLCDYVNTCETGMDSKDLIFIVLCHH